MVQAFDVEAMESVRSIAERLGPAPDDPQVSINWSFHSRSDSYKRSVKQELQFAADLVVDRLLDDHVVYLTTFITKWPGGDGGFAPHQDPSLVDEREFRGVTVWIPLEDTDENNGALHVVPGSHRLSSQLRPSDVDRAPFVGLDQVVVERLGRVVPTVAGEALIFDNRVLHYSLPNWTDRPRIVLSFGVRPREASCILLRDLPDGRSGVWHIDDDFYIDVLPMEQHRYNPPGAPADVIVPIEERWTATDIERLCSFLADAPRAHDPSYTTWFDPGAFCAVCGGTTDLDAADRVGRNNAQLVCRLCRSS